MAAMKSFFVFVLLSFASGDRLTDNYLPPSEDLSTGGNPGSIYAPVVELARSSFGSGQNLQLHQQDYEQRANSQGEYGQIENNQIEYDQKENNQRMYGQRENNQREYGQGENNQRMYSQRENNQREYGQRENNQRMYGQRENNQREYGQRENNQRMYSYSPRDNSQREYGQRENYQKEYDQSENNQRMNNQIMYNARPQKYNNPQAQVYILKQDSDINQQGYYYAYETSDGTKAEQEGQFFPGANDEEGSMSVHGSYSYVGDDGKTYLVRYVADENGYRVEGDHLPTPPTISRANLKSQQQQQREDSPDYDGNEHQRTNFNTNIGYRY